MEIDLDASSDRPLYRQLADVLRDAVISKEIEPGGSFPSERALAEEHGLARGTVHEAFNLLKAEGLLETRRGHGAYARIHPPVQRLGWDRLSRRHREAGKGAYLIEMEHAGRTPKVDSIEIVPALRPSPEVAERLHLTHGELVAKRSRRYLADGEPLQLATSYVRMDLAQGTRILDEDTGPGGIYARIEDQGVKLSWFSEDVTARMAAPEEARDLRLPPGVPVVVVIRVAYADGDRPVEECDTVLRADRYVLRYQLLAE
jgi:GntR family transcriptional regulator